MKVIPIMKIKMKKFFILWLCAVGGLCAYAQFKFKRLDNNDGKTSVVIVDDYRSPFYYFNEQWIPGASVEMICADSISNMEVKNDNYGNRAVFVTIPSHLLDSLKSKVNEVYKDVWLEYDPTCEFPGGNGKLKEWIKENIRIPVGFKGKERVVVGFKVQPDGTVSDGKIIRSNNENLNQEALRLVESLPKFYVRYYTPKKEPIFMALPILFENDDTIYLRGE